MISALHAALTAALGDPTIPILRTWTNPAPPPPPPDRTVLYYHLTPGDSPPLTEEAPGARFSFSPWKLELALYGPRALETAWRVYHGLFQDGHGAPRALLRAAGLYPVPRVPGPVLLWEELEKQRRLRADLTLPLYLAHEEEGAPAGLVETPPEVITHT